MKTQQDSKVRMVALENLKAMCKRVSGVCHRYSVTKVSRSRVHVEYSNPDEYGHEHPMTAVFPCYPSGFGDDAENPRVILEYLRIMNDNWDGEGWQAFEILRDCPVLWRNPEGNVWAPESNSPPGPKSGFGKEETKEDIQARIDWEVWAAGNARKNNHEALAQGHDLTRAEYQKLLEKLS